MAETKKIKGFIPVKINGYWTMHQLFKTVSGWDIHYINPKKTRITCYSISNSGKWSDESWSASA